MSENATIGVKKTMIDSKKAVIETVNKAFENRKISKINHTSLLAFCEEMEINRVFGRTEVMVILQCKDNKAGKVIELLNELGVVLPVNGKGKGKYILKGQ